MHAELSTEARRVLTAYAERLESIPEIQEDKRRIVRYQVMAVRKAFEALGLDLEGEGTDG